MACDGIVCGERGDERELGRGAGAYAKPQPEGRVEIALRRVPSPAGAPAPLGLLIRDDPERRRGTRAKLPQRLGVGRVEAFEMQDICGGGCLQGRASEQRARGHVGGGLERAGSKDEQDHEDRREAERELHRYRDWVEGCALLVEVHDLDDA